MIRALVAAAIFGASPTAPAPPLSSQPLAEAAHAIGAGRLEQARAMIAAAVRDGATGEPVERLLADLAFAQRDDLRALAIYSALSQRQPDDALVAERAGIAALRLGDDVRAAPLLARATAASQASWRAWNARGVAADRRRDWTDADLAYARAAALAADRPEIANNHGWSLLIRGRWEEALAALDRAAALDPDSRRIADNRDLARAALADGLPTPSAGESDEAWAARLNDAGVAAASRGENQRAIAAFAQAIAARSVWFDRASNNLAVVEARR